MEKKDKIKFIEIKAKCSFFASYNHPDLDELVLVESPVANCQTFSIRYARQIANLSKSDVPVFLNKCFAVTRRRQMLMDLEKSAFIPVKILIEPYCKNLLNIEYKSTNGSEMVLCLAQLDIEKINKATNNEDSET